MIAVETKQILWDRRFGIYMFIKISYDREYIYLVFLKEFGNVRIFKISNLLWSSWTLKISDDGRGVSNIISKIFKVCNTFIPYRITVHWE